MHRIFILYGNDVPLVYQNLDKIEQELKETIPSIQFQSFSEATLQEIDQFMDSGSLFGDIFCVKVKKIKGSLSLKNWISSPHYLIIPSDDEKDPFPKENSPIVKKLPCILPKTWDLLKIIQKFFGRNITGNAAEYLSSSLSSITELDEIKQQMDFYKISVLNMETLTKIYPAEDIHSYILVDYFFQPQQQELFFEGLHTLIQRGSSLDPFLNNLLRRTKDFIEIKKGLMDKKQIATIAKELKLHPFIVEKMLPTISTYTPRILKDLIIRIVETQCLSRFYSSQMDLMLVSRLFLEQKEASCLR